MSYIVFARKYRPKEFDEIVGQKFVATTLKNAIQGNRIAHAYPDPTGKKRQTSAVVGKTDFSIIKHTGVEVHARKHQGRKDRFNSVNKKLEEVTLTIDPSCKKLVRYFKSSAHDDKDESMTHLLDGATYPVAYLFPIHKPELKGITANRGQ